MTPAGTSNELDVQNEWEENTHTLGNILLGDRMACSEILNVVISGTNTFHPLSGQAYGPLSQFDHTALRAIPQALSSIARERTR